MSERNRHHRAEEDPSKRETSRQASGQAGDIPSAGITLLEEPPPAARDLGGDTGALGPGPILLSLFVNGRAVSVSVDPATTLVDVLRHGLGLTGTKIGCERGACSACTVWLDGDVAASCMTFALDARGKHVTTIEGLGHGETLHPVQQAFVDHDALQCGFCTPGMVMSCAALVEHNPQCTLDDVKAAVSGHLCRCGTYPNIFKAVLAAAGSEHHDQPKGGQR
jgi:xanthine dehydrogenase YagT iron-sulfur-binding subunit